MSVIWQGEPAFSADELQGATRYKIGDYYVDWNEVGEPTLDIIKERLGLTEAKLTEKLIATLELAIDRHLDAVANSYRYESIRTMVTYAASAHIKFGAEGKAAIKFRDAVYAHGIKTLEDVQAGLREVPTETELIAELPKITDFLTS